MKNLIIVCCVGLVFANNIVPDMNKDKVAQLDKEILTLIWKQAMECC